MSNTGVSGKTRYGKSYLVKKEVIPRIKENKPVVIFDRKGEYAGKGAKDVPGTWKKHSGIIDLFDDIAENDSSLEGVNVIRCKDDSDYIHGLSFFHALVDQATAEKPVTLVMDEAQDIFISSDFDKAREPLIRLMRYGAQYGVDFIFISQRYMDLPPDIRTQIESVISFRQNSKSDVKALEQDFGLDNAEKLIKLKKREFIFHDLPKSLQELKNNDYAK